MTRPLRRPFFLRYRFGFVLPVLAGALGALAMQPFAFWPIMIPAITLAVLMIDQVYLERDRMPFAGLVKRAALIGWLWGFGYFTASLWWLGKAFLVEADEFAWAMPFGVVGLPAVLAFFCAAAFALALCLWSRNWSRIFAFAFSLASLEWLRGNILTGFPWNAPGMALGNHLWFMQSASIIGLYGLTAVTILIAAAPATLMDRWRGQPDWRASVLALACVGMLAGYGYWRIPPNDQPEVLNVRLRIIQPNIPQDADFNATNGEAILTQYLELSEKNPGDGGPTHYIWPESAFPFLLHRNLPALDRIGMMLEPGNAWLITGAARMGQPMPGEEAGSFYNAIQAIDRNGIIRDTYDKAHLVPFGEYEPAFSKSLLRLTGLRQFVSIPGGFTPAPERKPFSVPGLPAIAGSICYEAIFPGEVLPVGGPRPRVIINVTNDAWFGDSPGPRQHFAQARLRSVEEGMPLVRAANSGISGVIDPFGRVLSRTDLNTVAVIDSALPEALDRATFYSRWRNWPLAGMLLVFLGLALYGRSRKAFI